VKPRKIGTYNENCDICGSCAAASALYRTRARAIAKLGAVHYSSNLVQSRVVLIRDPLRGTGSHMITRKKIPNTCGLSLVEHSGET
jgi:hypothetical protein